MGEARFTGGFKETDSSLLLSKGAKWVVMLAGSAQFNWLKWDIRLILK
jgi:hypothetical protein